MSDADSDPFPRLVDAAQRLRSRSIGINDFRAIAVGALNEEREQARAPFAALANWLETTDDPFRDDPTYIAAIIRCALAEDSP